MKTQRISKIIFGSSLFFVVLMIFVMFFYPNQTKMFVDRIFNFLCYDLGWLFLLTVFITFIFSIYLAVSKYGKIKLGDGGTTKAYSEKTWAAMLFTAGLGTAVTVLSFIEPLMFLQKPPFGIESMSEKAFEYALMPDQFFWGIFGWATYIPFVVAVCISLFIKQDETLRLSTACNPLLGKHSDKWYIKIIDVVGNIGIAGGMASSLGLGIPVVAKFLSKLTGAPETLGLTVGILFTATLIVSLSVFMGLDKGIKRLSDFNMYLLAIIAVAFLTVNPLNDSINLWVNSLGLMLDNFGKLCFSTDPIVKTGFAQSYVIFYWAWFLTFSPMMGLFVARISKGRTLRQVIVGLLTWGGLGTMVCFAWFGSYAVKLQHEGTIDLVGIYQRFGREEAIYRILETLPFAKVISWIYIVLVFVFIATTVNSTVYALTSTCTDHLQPNEQPRRWTRIMWAAILMLFALGLILIGGLETIQTAALLTGLPLVFVSLLLILSSLKELKRHSLFDGRS